MGKSANLPDFICLFVRCKNGENSAENPPEISGQNGENSVPSGKFRGLAGGGTLLQNFHRIFTQPARFESAFFSNPVLERRRGSGLFHSEWHGLSQQDFFLAESASFLDFHTFFRGFRRLFHQLFHTCGKPCGKRWTIRGKLVYFPRISFFNSLTSSWKEGSVSVFF